MMRAAVFFTPAPETELARAAAEWLGRDAFTGSITRAPDPIRDPWVADPARYGFHATLKAPFRLATGIDLSAVARRLQSFCETRPPPRVERLVLARLGSFHALVPDRPDPAVSDLEADVVRAFERFRAPLEAAEIARRGPDRLSERQLAHLHRWGYPFVLDEFRFHMTLTGPLPDDTRDIDRTLEAHFSDVIGRPLPIAGLGLFVEPGPGLPFRVHAYHPFGSPLEPSSQRAP